MKNDDLITGIKKHMQCGDDCETIRRHVLEAGYSESDFREAYVASGGQHNELIVVGHKKIRAVIRITLIVLVALFVTGGIVLAVDEPLRSNLLGRFSNDSIVNEDGKNATECKILESVEIQGVRAEMADLEEQIKKLDSGYSTGTSTNWEERLATINQQQALSEKYASSSVRLTRLSMSAIDKRVIDKVYQEYCTGGSPQVGLDIELDGSLETIESIAKADPNGLVCSLSQHQVEDNKVHQALNQVGMYYMQVGDFDRGIDFYNCAAERYYNPTAMYRLAQLYWYGSDSLTELMSKDGTEVKITTPVARNIDQAYYWIVAETWAAIYLKSPHVDAGTGYGWNSIALLDAMQQSSEVSSQMMVTQEEKVIEFLAPKFPQILSEKSKVYNHSMRAMIDSLENNDANVKVNTTAPTTAPKETNTVVENSNFFKSDSEIQYILKNTRVAAELFYNGNGTAGYVGLCDAILNKKLSSPGLDYMGINYTCRAPSKDTYLISASLANGEYCIDSTGFTSQIPATPKGFSCQ